MVCRGLPFEMASCKNFACAKTKSDGEGPISERNFLMRFKLMIVLLSLLIAAGCGAATTPQPVNGSQTAVETAAPSGTSPASQPSPPAATAEAAAVKPKLDACALLTSKEIESVQGEALKETKLTGQSTGGFSMSQCFFTLPTFTNSISLLVAQKGEGVGAHDPKDYWRDTFHEDKGKDKDKDRDRAGDPDKKKGAEEEEEGAPPQKVPGVGDDAYWMGTRVGGALYVLKGNAYVRISIGGPADQASKIRKSKTLAQRALKRL
jgi:hypothetical protein